MPTISNRSALGAAATLMGAGGLWYLFAENVSASAFRPRYDYAYNFISDLGVPTPGNFEGRAIDSPLSSVMNAGFLGQALFMFLAGVILYWVLPTGRARGAVLALAAAHAAGLSMVGLVPGSTESAELGLGVFHVGGAVVAILCGNFLAILAGTRSLRPELGPRLSLISVLLGTTGIVSLIVLIASQAVGTSFVFDYGVWERGAVYTFLLFELLFAITALSRRARTNVSTEQGASVASVATTPPTY